MKQHLFKVISFLLVFMLAMTALNGVIAFADSVANTEDPVFADVPSNAWYAKAVSWARDNDVFQGTSETTFSPDAPMTRAMMVTVIYRMYGGFMSVDMEDELPFTDINNTSYYYDALKWCYALKIINGTSATTFSPNNAITREQVAAIMHRVAKTFDFGAGPDGPNYVVTPTGDLNRFPDADEISNYAKEDMLWCVENNLISGTAKDGEVFLAPRTNTTRAQVAMILMRFEENIN